MSTSSALRQSAKAPIKVYGLGGRYAHALYAAANKQNKLDVVDTELTTLQNTLNQNEKLAAFVSNPSVNKQNKLGVLQDFAKEQKMSDLSSNFVALLTENNRLNKLKDVLSAWSQIMSAHKGEVVCNIKTAKALDSSQEKQLREALAAFVKKGDSLKINTEIDPTILGGMVGEIGDKYIDMSVATKVKKMTQLISEAV
ncbi:ATP synthase subunit O, mitochondrial-like [Amphiura filiformis]|uniref:ATP synthase subunit O, mitochondrial-like n=1 Tax=Amphiura filiformis TaxID=82378 RepID=UPI003B2177E5